MNTAGRIALGLAGAVALLAATVAFRTATYVAPGAAAGHTTLTRIMSTTQNHRILL